MQFYTGGTPPTSSYWPCLERGTAVCMECVFWKCLAFHHQTLEMEIVHIFYAALFLVSPTYLLTSSVQYSFNRNEEICLAQTLPSS